MSEREAHPGPGQVGGGVEVVGWALTAEGCVIRVVVGVPLPCTAHREDEEEVIISH